MESAENPSPLVSPSPGPRPARPGLRLVPPTCPPYPEPPTGSWGALALAKTCSTWRGTQGGGHYGSGTLFIARSEIDKGGLWKIF